MIGLFSLLLSPLLLATASAIADSATTTPARDSVLVLPEIAVERERLSAARRRLPTAFVTELHPAGSARALETLTEALGEAAGVHVVQYGGLGAFSTVSLRGAPPGQVSIFVDGQPLTSAAHGVVNLADLPVAAIERIEVYRGLAPLALGLATPGGAINLVTIAATAATDVRVVRGSFDTWEARGTTGARHGALGVLAHGGWQRSAGDFRFPDDNGTPFNLADDSVSTRVNNAFEAATGLLTFDWQPGAAFTARARADVFQKRQGLPGLGAVPALRPRLSFLRSLSSLELERDAVRAWPALRLRAGLQRERSRFSDPNAELGLGRHDTDDRTAGEDLVAALEWPRLPLGLATQGSGSWRNERAELNDAGDSFADPPGSRRVALGASLAVQLHTFAERVVLHAARRWDRLEDELRASGVGGITTATNATRELDAPQLGVRVAALRGVELRGNWTRATRAPDFLELFGNQGSVLGNAQLTPERAESWDAGIACSIERRRARATLEWAHFESHARDLILYVRNSQSSVRAQNVSRAEISGDEISARISLPGGISLAGAWTAQSALDRGPVPFWYGRRLPQRPAREGWAELGIAIGRVNAAANVHALGDNFLDRANRQRVASRTLVGASLSTQLFADLLRLTLEGKNLGDERAADVGGFPLPGRSVFAAVQVRLTESRQN